jgi:adenylate cyclase class 2
MHTEIEERILEVNKDEVINKLESLGAKKVGDWFQKRYVYDFIPKVGGKWIRLRTNGLSTTLTIKNIVSSEIDGTQELEITVDDFEKTNLILNELGYEAKSYQENRRIQYEYGDVEIDIDYWPGIPTYLEIEGTSEEDVYDVLNKLGFKKEDATTRDVMGIYEDYGVPVTEKLTLEEDRKNHNRKENKK